jgi:hypothetical protein
MRTLITADPFPGKSDAFYDRGIWPGEWIGDPTARGQEPAVTAFRRAFSIDTQANARIHVSADERYELFLDGNRVGRGPERSDPENWMFETYELDLTAGPHVLVARTWWMGPTGNSPYAQMTVRPGFLLVAEGPLHERLSTGVAPWESVRLDAYEFLPLDQRMKWAGAKLRIRGERMQWDVPRGEGDGWRAAEIVGQAQSAVTANCAPLIWRLRPAMLPPMLDREIHVGTARHVQEIPSLQTTELRVIGADHLPDEAEAWDRMLHGDGAVTLPPRTRRRVIVDLGDYYCAYPQLLVSGGAGATIRLHWAESLFEPGQRHAPGQRDAAGNLLFPAKGNRDDIEGKVFNGVGDVFEPDGGSGRLFNPLWWEAGRYLEFLIVTADEPLTIERFSLIETRYPHRFDHRFESSDARLADVTPPALRTLEMCSHETYMDCPYYEQLMYLGDTRLQVLTTYAVSRDDRLPRKALWEFDVSRGPSGLTQSRYPSRMMQVIPPFSLWWIAMVHDFAMWRDDPTFVAARMPGVRGVLDAFLQRVNRDRLLDATEGWNFVDWVPGWVDGVPPGGSTGISGLLNFHLVWALRQAAELEDFVGEPELAARNRRHADAVARAAATLFWNEHRGLFADDLAHEHFSEHTQCLALLADAVPLSRRDRCVQGLLTDPNLARTTIYFAHYLFETFRLLRLPHRIFDRMGLWFDLKANGLRTTVEMPEPCRSDSHAWGAHPVFHFHASILGIRPAGPGFTSVQIEPQLGPLAWARGTMPHPRGDIRADFALRDGRLTGEIELPPGVIGTLLLPHSHATQPLHPGTQRF